MTLAHVAGLPLEETALSLAPLGVVALHIAQLQMRRWSERRDRARARR